MSLCEPLRKEIETLEQEMRELYGSTERDFENVKDCALSERMVPRLSPRETAYANENDEEWYEDLQSAAKDLHSLWQDLHECELMALEEAKSESNKH